MSRNPSKSLENQTFPPDLSRLVKKQGLILGSGSPRRQEILSYFHIPFRVETSNFDEESLPFEGDPIAYVRALAVGKGSVLSEKHPDELILSADTIVYFNGKVYGKPKDKEEGKTFLKELRGHPHEVWTGICLTFNGKCLTEETRSLVYFKNLSDAQIDLYQSNVATLDKAAGYAVQQVGGILVDRIDGDFYNIMGLPLSGVETLFQKAGLTLWDYLA